MFLNLKSDTFLPLLASLCELVSVPQEASGNRRVDFVASHQQLILHQQKVCWELNLFQDRLGCNPGLT